MAELDSAFSLFDDSDDEEESIEQEGQHSTQDHKRVRTKSCEQLSIKVRREQALANMIRWIKGDPFSTLSDKVIFQVDDEGNVSAATVKDVPEGELLLSLHPRYCLKAYHEPRAVEPGQFDAASLAAQARNKMAELGLGTTQFFARDDVSTLELQILVMWELCKGKGSFYWPYFEALNEPSLIFTLPLFWDAERVAGLALTHTEAHRTLVVARKDVDGICTKVIVPLLAERLAPFVNGGKSAQLTTFGLESVEDLYKYAVGITLSRHFTNGDYVALVPFCDLFNGRPEGQNNVITERSPPVLKYKQYTQLKQLQAQVGFLSPSLSPSLSLPSLRARYLSPFPRAPRLLILHRYLVCISPIFSVTFLKHF
jgi:hypothetical protein